MEYELVQRLKEAGYPVNPPDVPDLSELIEACGMEEVVNAVIERRMIQVTETEVAKLWLALNTK